MFASTSNIPAAPPRTGGVQAERISTNEAARPLPYFAGTRRIGITFISDPFDIRSEPVTSSGGKGGGQVTGYRYFASFAFLLAHGVVEKLYKIWIENELVWEGDLTLSTNTTAVTIENFGELSFWRGGEDATIDPDLAASGQVHSAYRGQSGGVFKGLFFGEGKTQAPMIEFEVGRWPKPAWLDGFENIEGDANAACIAWEWLTNVRYGRGLPEDRLDVTKLTEVGETLFDEELGVSPFLDSEKSMRTALAMLTEHIDGYLTGDDGLIGLGLVREVVSPVATFTTADIVGRPKFSKQSWDQTRATTLVDFKDRLNGWPDSGTKYHDRANWQITGENKSKSLSREWATRFSVAQRIANALGRVAGKPQQSGSLSVLRSSLNGLKPGDVFVIDYDPRGLLIRCRAKTVTVPSLRSRSVDITWEEDRAWANVAYAEEVQDPVTPEDPLAPVDFYDADILEMPFGMVGAFSSAFRLDWTSTWGRTEMNWANFGLLFARGNLVTTGFRIAYKVGDTNVVVYPTLFTRFMMRGALTAAYSAVTSVIDESERISFELLSPDKTFQSEPTIDEALGNQILMFIGNESTGEILSLFDIENTGGNNYTASTIRARYDTQRTAHADNAVCWITTGAFEVQRLGYYDGVDYNFKGQPMVQNDALPIEDCTLITKQTQYRSYRPLPPANLFANGDGVSPIWVDTEDVIISWTPQSPESVADDAVFDTDYPQYGDRINLKVYRTADGVLVQDIFANYADLTGDQTSYTLDNADLITWLGSRQPFYVRAFCYQAGYGSFRYNEIQVDAP